MLSSNEDEEPADPFFYRIGFKNPYKGKGLCQMLHLESAGSRLDAAFVVVFLS